MKVVSSNNRKIKWELYDLSKDISEKNNLAEKQPATFEKLVEEWDKLNEEMVDAVFR